MGQAPVKVQDQFDDQQKLEVTELFNNGMIQKDIAKQFGVSRRTIGKLCKYLGLKRSTSEVGKIVVKSSLDKPEVIEQIRELRESKSLSEIADMLNSSKSAVHRICKKHNIDLPDNYSELQSQRIKAAWDDPEKREAASEKAKEDVNKPEVIKKISESSKKCWSRDDYRQKQIDQKNNWDDKRRGEYSKKMRKVYQDNPEIKERISELSKRMWEDPEYRKEMSRIRKEMWKDPEYIESQANSRPAWTDEMRKQYSIMIKQIYKDDPSIGERISASSKKMWEDPVYRSKMINVVKNMWKDDNFRSMMSEMARDQWKDDDFRQMMSERSKKMWEDPEYKQKMIEMSRQLWQEEEYVSKWSRGISKMTYVSSLQNTLYSILDDLDVIYYRERQDGEDDLQCSIGPYSFDCVVPRDGQKDLLIECQGDYWHSKKAKISVDNSKATYIERYYSEQYEIKYLWEHEFQCKNRIIETLKYWLGITNLEIKDFDFDEVKIDRCKAEDYKKLLGKYHYLSNAPRGGKAFGAYLGEELIAVCIFSPLLRQNITVKDYEKDEVRELSRLCIHPRYQKRNFASWFVSRCIKALDDKYKCILSYTDTTFNHDGAVYKALNFQLDGQVRPDYWYAAEDGWVMHKRTLYGKANQFGLKEAEYAEKFGYKKVYGKEKLRFIYER